jgi:hypothetical protein
MCITNTSFPNTTPTTLFSLARDVIVQNITSCDVIKKLPIPYLVQKHIEDLPIIEARKVVNLCYGHYQHKNLQAKIISLFSPIKDDKFVKEQLLPFILDIGKKAELGTTQIYALRHERLGRVFIESDSVLLTHLGSLHSIINYIKTNANSQNTFSKFVAETLLTSYLDVKPNAITLLPNGYNDLIHFAKQIDESKLTEQQKITSFKELILHIKNTNAQGCSQIEELDINDPIMNLRPGQLRRQFRITARPCLDFLLLKDELLKRNGIKSIKKMTYEDYQRLSNTYLSRSSGI